MSSDQINFQFNLYIELKFACNVKYDPKMETGIPLIKSKPTTKIVPFKFATDERSTKRPK